MELDGLKVAVVGAGIGGLAAALCLRTRGADVLVLEQAEAIREVGAGIQVSPNGMKVLRALGLAEDLRARTVGGRAVVLRDYRGAQVLRMELSALEDAGDYRFVHRADIIELLAGAARDRGVKIRLLQKATEVVPGAPARVVLCHGDHVEADLVVGADGLHSVLRPVLNGSAAPFFTGQVAWRAVVPNVVDHPPEAWVHMGPGRHVVSYPLRGGEMVNLVAVEERRGWVEEGWAQVDDAANLRAAFAAFRGPVTRLISEVEQPGLWGLFRHPVAQTWHGTGVALLGDAAHPTLPFLAQGANMALEDAWALGAAVGAEGLGGLARYQDWRRDRVARVIAAANGNAWKYHLRNPLVRGVAHMGLGLVGRLAPEKMLRQFDWVYGYDVTRLGG
ncbi:FAD-dependent monooxygenase [Sagittula sp. S175]|uniref:FAD-dependent monooxygenase n=1 Tax=Sagittula sp. S175 TaxID=3415129 RepID=UPI003C7A1A7F